MVVAGLAVFLVLVVTRKIFHVCKHTKTKKEESRVPENDRTVSSVLKVTFYVGKARLLEQAEKF
jgi:hypothetical protein